MEVQPNRVNKDDLRKFLSIAPGGISRIVGIAPRRRLQFPSVRDSVKGRTSISFSIRHAQDTPDRDQAQQGVGIRPAPEKGVHWKGVRLQRTYWRLRYLDGDWQELYRRQPELEKKLTISSA